MPENNSASGGYLQPGAPLPLSGQALNRFVQQWISGVSGLDGDLVRVTRQTEPPDVPAAGEAWCAVTVGVSEPDEFPYVNYSSTAAGGQFAQQRHEQLDLLVCFYDLGVSGQADALARRFRNGALIAQNREILTLNNFGLVRCGRATPAPTLLNQRWQYRVDVECVLRYESITIYPVETIVSASGDIYTDGGLPPQPF
jgi:hypothetical protein